MKFRKSGGSDKIELQMTPMIDVVFQLLVFFIFTFKIVPIEGEIAVNMPPIEAGAQSKPDEIDITEKINIKLVAAADGHLASIQIGERVMGSDPRALTQTLKDNFVGPGGNTDDVEVELDSDRMLLYKFVMDVTNAIMRANIEKINFTDPEG